MKVLAAAALMLAGCVTAPAPPERIAGCWIERSDRGAATMRWFPDPNRPGVIEGAYLSYAEPNASAAYTLTRTEGGWNFCRAAGSDEERCWAVARGDSGSLEGGRAFIDIHGERLRVAIVEGSAERVIFQGARDGCD